MRIQFKLILIGFAVIAVLMAVVGFGGIQSTQEVGENFNEIDVSMSDMKVATNPRTLRSTGIGSCVVITLYDCL